jgi:preprotein translocase subunit SecY
MNYFTRIWHVKDLRKKILFTLFVVLVYRLASNVTIPGINMAGVSQIFEQNKMFGLFSAFTGGSIENFSLLLMGLSPYINASIIMQLMAVVFKKIEELSKEGEQGRKTLTRYTRFLTIPLALLQSYGMMALLNSSGKSLGLELLDMSSWGTVLPVMLSITAGTIFAMWLGELISEKGIGNGISVIIFSGIVAGIPPVFNRVLGVGMIDTTKMTAFIGFLVFTLALLVVITLFTEAYRNIPITYATRGNTAQKSSLPLKLNQAGMVPIIFAMSLITFPLMFAQYLGAVYAENSTIVSLKIFIETYLNSMNPSYTYIIIYFLLVWGFSYFYVSITFKPDQIADNIQKRGGFIPGLRPGKETESYITKTSANLTFWGGLFLSLVAVVPLFFTKYTVLTSSDMVISGSGLIIVVGVVLEIIRQINAHLVSHDYDKI